MGHIICDNGDRKKKGEPVMFTFALTAAFIAPLFAASILDEEEKSDPDIVRRPHIGVHERSGECSKAGTKIEILPVSERFSDDYASFITCQAAGG